MIQRLYSVESPRGDRPKVEVSCLNRRGMTNHAAEMQKRINNGEFGSPPQMDKVNAAWEIILSDVVKESKPTYVSVSGLWQGKGKVAFQGYTSDEITIPAGVKLLAFNNDKEGNPDRPDLNLVYVDES